MRLRCLQVRKKTESGQVFYKYRGQSYPQYLNEGGAVLAILEKAKEYCRGRGIDVGADKWPYPSAIPIQNEDDQNAYKLDSFPDASLDYVFSSHCLEHLDNWQHALALWIKKLKPKGILFLYLPHESMVLWHPHHPWAGNNHKWVPRHEIINDFLTKNGMRIIEFNANKDRFLSFHIVAEKLNK